MKQASSILLFSLLTIVYGCSEPDCVRSATSFVNISFYSLADFESEAVRINRIQAIGSDSVLVADEEDVTAIRLPLDPQARQTTFAFDTEYGIDTLSITYRISSFFISEDCGVEMIFKDLGYSRNDFDSVNIINNILIEDINEDIRIYN